MEFIHNLSRGLATLSQAKRADNAARPLYDCSHGSPRVDAFGCRWVNKEDFMRAFPPELLDDDAREQRRRMGMNMREASSRPEPQLFFMCREMGATRAKGSARAVEALTCGRVAAAASPIST